MTKNTELHNAFVELEDIGIVILQILWRVSPDSCEMDVLNIISDVSVALADWQCP